MYNVCTMMTGDLQFSMFCYVSIKIRNRLGGGRTDDHLSEFTSKIPQLVKTPFSYLNAIDL